MNAFDKLVEVGAQVVGGDVIYKNQYAGHFKNGVFVTTDFGDSVLAMDIMDVVAKPLPAASVQDVEPKPLTPQKPRGVRQPRMSDLEVKVAEPVATPPAQTASVVDLLKDE